MSMYYRDFAGSGHTDHYDAGQYISRNAGDDDTVFSNIWPHPQTVYYAKRNIQTVRDVGEAIDWLKAHGRKRGILFIGEISNGEKPHIGKIVRHVNIAL